MPWVERITKSVPEEVERKHRKEYRRGRREQQPWRVFDGGGALRLFEHDAPTDLRILDADTEIA